MAGQEADQWQDGQLTNGRMDSSVTTGRTADQYQKGQLVSGRMDTLDRNDRR